LLSILVQVVLSPFRPPKCWRCVDSDRSEAGIPGQLWHSAKDSRWIRPTPTPVAALWAGGLEDRSWRSDCGRGLLLWPVKCSRRPCRNWSRHCWKQRARYRNRSSKSQWSWSAVQRHWGAWRGPWRDQEPGKSAVLQSRSSNLHFGRASVSPVWRCSAI